MKKGAFTILSKTEGSTCCNRFFPMPKRLIFTSDLSAIPQTPCPSAFRLKDIPHEMFQPENILQNNHSSENKTG